MAARERINASSALKKNLEELLSRFPDEKVIRGIIGGWYEENAVTCVSCAENEEFVTGGLQVVGAFCCFGTNDALENALEAVEQCQSILDQTVSEEHAVVFSVTGKEPSEAEINACLYSLHYNTTTNPSVVYKDDLEIFSDCVVARCIGQFPLVFEFDSNEEVVKHNIEKCLAKTKCPLETGAAGFILKEVPLLLSKSADEKGDATVQSIVKKLEESQQDNRARSKKKKLNQHVKDKMPLNFQLLLKVTGEDNTEHTPVIHYERRDLTAIRVPISLDVIALVKTTDSVDQLQAKFTKGISQQMDQVVKFLAHFNKNTNFHIPSVYHFWPSLPTCGHSVTVLLPKDMDDDLLVDYRTELHKKLCLPTDRPLLRKTSRFQFTDELPTDGCLRNTHFGLVSASLGSQVGIVEGTYTYHHYMQDRMDDNGWGCAYRSLQTIVSWFSHQGYTDKQIPTHKEIQKALVDVGDKPANFIGSKQWIGSQEVSFCLSHLIGVTSKIMVVSSGSELATKGRELLNHFQTNGTPIMIGGGVLAHTILGVDYDENTGDIKFLVLDPHYTGTEDLAVIQNKGWCGWKNGDFWDKNAFYNLCLPQRPQII